MDLTTQGYVLVVANLFGFYLAYLYGRKTKRFRWSEYVALFLAPLLTVVLLAYLNGPKIIRLFFVSAAVGSCLEYIMGLAYQKTLNSRLWEYKRLSIHGHTSLLSIPFWGVAGVAFYFIAKIIGL